MGKKAIKTNFEKDFLEKVEHIKTTFNIDQLTAECFLVNQAVYFRCKHCKNYSNCIKMREKIDDYNLYRW